jgi:hypothetical protein
MKPVLKRFTVFLLFLTILAAAISAQQPQPGIGKVDFAALFNAAPPLPATPAEAANRTFVPGDANESTAPLEAFYEPFNKRVAAARDTIKPAIDSRPARHEAMSQQAIADANSSAVIAGMGGIDKISQMSDQEREQAALQAVGNVPQNSGAPPQAGAGMQAIMQRMMNDPAYAERFEKMSQAEQEAEMRKAMGAPMAQHSAAEEKRAMQGSEEAAAVKARLDQLQAIHQRILNVDSGFDKKDQAITNAPGSHDEISKATGAKMAKVPLIEAGELGHIPDPAQVKALQREQATRNRARAEWELKQRADLYASRKTAYLEAAAAYANWSHQEPIHAVGSTAKLMQDSASDLAIDCEVELIKLSENLAQYSHDATRKAAGYELAFQKRMSER